MLKFNKSISIKSIIVHLLMSLFCNAFVYCKTFFIHLFMFYNTKKDVLLPGIYIHAVNSLFWFYQAEEFKRVGPRGTSNLIGDGNYEMQNLWHASPLSFLLFRKFGVILSTISFVFVPFIFCMNGNINLFKILIICFIFYSSPIVFSMSFVLGRYHSPAWFLLVLSTVSYINDFLLISTLSILLISMTSTTVLLFAFLLNIYFSIYDLNFNAIFVIIPSLLYTIIYLFYIFWSCGGLSSVIKKVMQTFSGIGFIKSKVRFKRKKHKFYEFNKLQVYFISVFIFQIVLLCNHSESNFLLSIFGLIIYIINEKFARFCDSQSSHYFGLLCGLFDIYIQNLTILSYTSLLPWIFFAFFYKTSSTSYYDHLKVIKPYKLEHIIKNAVKCFKNIKHQKRIFALFPDPKSNYENVFFGQRQILELLIYAAYRNNICLLPNWLYLFKNINNQIKLIWVNNNDDLIALKDLSNNKYFIYPKVFFNNETLDLSIIFKLQSDLSVDTLSKQRLTLCEWYLCKSS